MRELLDKKNGKRKKKKRRKEKRKITDHMIEQKKAQCFLAKLNESWQSWFKRFQPLEL